MANNNRANAERALNVVDMGNLKVQFKIGKNERQVTRIYVWDTNGKKVVDRSVSSLTRQCFFEDLLKEVKAEFCTSFSEYEAYQGSFEDLLEEIKAEETEETEEEAWDEAWHKKSIEIAKSDMLDEIRKGEDVEKVIKNYLRFSYLTDYSLCEGWLNLKKFHKVVKLSNGDYYTDDQIRMIKEVMNETL